MKEISVKLPHKSVTVPYGTRVDEIFRQTELDNQEYPLMGAFVNNELTSLSFKVEINATIRPLTLKDEEGARIYRKSLSYLLSMAKDDLFPQRRLIIGHSLNASIFFYFDGQQEITEEELLALEKRMKEYVSRDIPILRTKMAYTEALDHFKGKKESKELLLTYRNESKIPVYRCGSYLDLGYEPLAPRTGLLNTFALQYRSPGFLLRYPHSTNPGKLTPFEDNPLLFSIYQEYKAWGKILNVDCAGKLNRLSTEGNIQNFIWAAETLHEKKLTEIAENIARRRDELKVVLIAGPSSSGKTTFTKKLAIHLRVMGFNPIPISLDDYYVPREQTPLDEDGKYDFEALEAIDIKVLNEHLLALFAGEEVELPTYDFKSGTRKYLGHRVKMEKRNILMMEGIHGLNDRLTSEIANSQKFKIYISALTQLNLDHNNRIATTDNRLLRRIVRDYQFRGYDALKTLGMWYSVKRGEKRNIFPFQNNADMAFNSALDYELPVLMNLAVPILKEVKPFHAEYAEALRLLEFLNNFVPIPIKHVPNTSILREFVGDSDFKY